jgi:putative oxidoreductase
MNNYKTKLIDLGILWLRILMGSAIAYHGWGKVSGGDLSQFAQGVAAMGFPAPLFFAWLSALAEFLGGICIVLGFATRLAAFFVFFNMSVAAFKFHAHDPFRVKELALAYWVMAGTIVLLGAGKYSLDAIISKKFKLWNWIR